jgi:hypothetical protein
MTLIYPNASHLVSAVEWNLWIDPDVMRIASSPGERRIINGIRTILAHQGQDEGCTRWR